MKTEIEAVKNIQTEGILEIENLGKGTGTTDASITNRTEEMEKRISSAEDTIQEIDSSVKENIKPSKA